MLSKDYRLRLTDIACRIKLERAVTLEEMVWYNKLVKHNKHAKALVGSLLGSDLMEDTDDFT